MDDSKHSSSAAARRAMTKAVAKALLISFAAEVLALLTGRLPWFSIVVSLPALAYLVEAFDLWREARALAQDEDDLRLIDAQLAYEELDAHLSPAA